MCTQVALGVCRSGARDGDFKDTAANILATGEFVVNIISEWFVEAANHTCGNYDAGINEFGLSGLTPMASTNVRPSSTKPGLFSPGLFGSGLLGFGFLIK